MNIKLAFVALSVISTVVLANGTSANAQTAPAHAKTVVEVKSGDTLYGIATANSTTYIRLFNANESIAHPDRIDVGDKITVPGKDEVLTDRFAALTQTAAPVVAAAAEAVVAPAPAPTAAPAAAQCNEATQWVRADNGQCLDKPVAARPVAVAQPVRQPVAHVVPAAQPVRQAVAHVAPAPAPAPAQASGAPAGAFGSYNRGNGWWCTDYVKSMRPDVPIYGNAGMYWIGAAQADGKATGTTPRAGAVAVMPGHVAYVESVNADGSFVVSEMGWMFQAGQFNRRTVAPGTFGGFIY